MRIASRRAHRGPNRHALLPVVHLLVEPGRAGLPGCARLAGHALALQRELGKDVRYRRVRRGRVPGTVEVVFQCADPQVGLLAAEAAAALVRRVSGEEDGDPRETVEAFLTRAGQLRLGPSTESLVRAAEERGIPWACLGDGSLIRLGVGRRQKRIRATLTAHTSVVAVDLAGDKNLANRLLEEAGLPVPQQRLVASADEAAAAAVEIGFPVVVKPLDANHGRGVSIGIRDEAGVRTAFDEALRVRDRVLVEAYVLGDDHRLLVVNGRLVAASHRVPGHVVGDGVSTVQELVAKVNRDPARGEGHEKILTRIVLDEEAHRLMAEQAVDVGTVVEEGCRVQLRRTANMSKGATAEDVTECVHPDNRWLAERAARVVGLDVAGVDFLTPDVTRSFREVGGAICEVNAAPGFRMHLFPTTGQPRDVAGAVLDMLFPPGTRATSPITAITGTNGKTTTARMVAHIHGLAGAQVGLASTEGVYVGGRRTIAGDMTGPIATRTVLDDPTVDHAVLELARGGILRQGLAIDVCDVGAVLNVGNDHLGFDDVHTVAEMAEVKGVVARIARDAAVLNADDPQTVALAQRCTRARRIAWVTMRSDNPLVRWHVRHGGLAAVLEQAPKGGTLTLYDAGQCFPLTPADDLPATLGGAAVHNAQNALFASAIAYAGGASVETIRRGLLGFELTWETAPGRLNVYREHPFQVIMDYGHNPEGFRAIGELALRMQVPGRRICVVGYPGNRRDDDVLAAARALVPYFDVFLCRGEDDPRGRPHDQIPRMFERAFREERVSPDRIQVVLDEAESIGRALSMAEAGDLVVVFAANLERTWQQITQFQPNRRQREPERRASWTG